jgi:REP element-mobilizing transposase RayT
MQQKGWYSRGYHPHLDAAGMTQSISFRLADSVPAHLIDYWSQQLKHTASMQSADSQQIALLRRIAQYEDSGIGACHLRDPRVAELVETELQRFDKLRYRLLAWCVMPNHVHVLIETTDEYPISAIVRGWKSHSAREANRLLAREGAFWMADYFDRYIRDEQHYAAVREYIHLNPVKAGLCATAEDWRWSSAWAGRALS